MQSRDDDIGRGVTHSAVERDSFRYRIACSRVSGGYFSLTHIRSRAVSFAGYHIALHHILFKLNDCGGDGVGRDDDGGDGFGCTSFEANARAEVVVQMKRIK